MFIPLKVISEHSLALGTNHFYCIILVEFGKLLGPKKSIGQKYVRHLLS